VSVHDAELAHDEEAYTHSNSRCQCFFKCQVHSTGATHHNVTASVGLVYLSKDHQNTLLLAISPVIYTLAWQSYSSWLFAPCWSSLSRLLIDKCIMNLEYLITYHNGIITTACPQCVNNTIYVHTLSRSIFTDNHIKHCQCSFCAIPIFWKAVVPCLIVRSRLNLPLRRRIRNRCDFRNGINGIMVFLDNSS
jgi:hypothetical protein